MDCNFFLFRDLCTYSVVALVCGLPPPSPSRAHNALSILVFANEIPPSILLSFFLCVPLLRTFLPCPPCTACCDCSPRNRTRGHWATQALDCFVVVFSFLSFFSFLFLVSLVLRFFPYLCCAEIRAHLLAARVHRALLESLGQLPRITSYQITDFKYL